MKTVNLSLLDLLFYLAPVCELISDYTASHPRRQYTSYSKPKKIISPVNILAAADRDKQRGSTNVGKVGTENRG
jgi:hypothetical protein